MTKFEEFRLTIFITFFLFQVVWDDEEEVRYRQWLREIQARRDSQVDWKELQDEEAFRAQIKAEEEEREGRPVDWEDVQERAYRRKYIEMRSVSVFPICGGER